MNDSYAQLLVNYCLSIKPKQRVLVRSSSIATPLLQSLYEELLKKGAYVEHMISFEDQDRLFYDHANSDQLSHISSFYEKAVREYDAIMSIGSPFNVKSTASVDQEKKKIAQKAMTDIRKVFMERSAKKELAWVLAVYPTQSAAQESGLSLHEYSDFVHHACMLYNENPSDSWKRLSSSQEKIVQRLNQGSTLRYKHADTDLSFSIKGRIWINSDGKYNMPSGEVFSSPVENSVNGHIHFDIPTVYDGKDVESIHLDIKDGIIQDWDAKVGKDVLDRVFSIDGARQFGEVAIGTNYSIKTPTKNILFDEKIGGTIHMAVGASYPETGGLNESAVHWDMIKTMSDGGLIYLDDELIYENGRFIIDEAADLNTLFN
ncbi:aminopeptidase [Candidatus Marinamargulisbacteria bacterium SCGC AG-343-D04]|nr:aminopeptidase [Candidatus Marinamargulisbacteria bacterium SCGC AG-343-D04]